MSFHRIVNKYRKTASPRVPSMCGTDTCHSQEWRCKFMNPANTIFVMSVTNSALCFVPPSTGFSCRGLCLPSRVPCSDPGEHSLCLLCSDPWGAQLVSPLLCPSCPPAHSWCSRLLPCAGMDAQGGCLCPQGWPGSSGPTAAQSKHSSSSSSFIIDSF